MNLKKLSLVLASVLFVSGAIAQNNSDGTLVTAPIRPFSTLDTFPTAWANEIKGGPFSYGTLSELSNIPTSRLSLGALGYVSGTDKYYKLSSTNPVAWQELSLTAANLDNTLQYNPSTGALIYNNTNTLTFNNSLNFNAPINIAGGFTDIVQARKKMAVDSLSSIIMYSGVGTFVLYPDVQINGKTSYKSDLFQPDEQRIVVYFDGVGWIVSLTAYGAGVMDLYQSNTDVELTSTSNAWDVVSGSSPLPTFTGPLKDTIGITKPYTLYSRPSTYTYLPFSEENPPAGSVVALRYIYTDDDGTGGIPPDHDQWTVASPGKFREAIGLSWSNLPNLNWNGLTNTNQFGFRSSFGVSETNNVGFRQVDVGAQYTISNNRIVATNVAATVSVRSNGIYFPTTNSTLSESANNTRSNLGLNWSAITNSNSATTLLGLETVQRYGTNIVPDNISVVVTDGELDNTIYFNNNVSFGNIGDSTSPASASFVTIHGPLQLSTYGVYAGGTIGEVTPELTINGFNSSLKLDATKLEFYVGESSLVSEKYYRSISPNGVSWQIKVNGDGIQSGNIIELPQFDGVPQSTNVIKFALPIKFGTEGFNHPTEATAAAITRTNLGLGATWLTNTNVTLFRNGIGLGATWLTETILTNFRTQIGLNSLASIYVRGDSVTGVYTPVAEVNGFLKYHGVPPNPAFPNQFIMIYYDKVPGNSKWRIVQGVNGTNAGTIYEAQTDSVNLFGVSWTPINPTSAVTLPVISPSVRDTLLSSQSWDDGFRKELRSRLDLATNSNVQFNSLTFLSAANATYQNEGVDVIVNDYITYNKDGINWSTEDGGGVGGKLFEIADPSWAGGSFRLYMPLSFSNNGNNFGFVPRDVAAITRTNLGLGATWLTNTNASNFVTAIGAANTNQGTYRESIYLAQTSAPYVFPARRDAIYNISGDYQGDPVTLRLPTNAQVGDTVTILRMPFDSSFILQNFNTASNAWVQIDDLTALNNSPAYSVTYRYQQSDSLDPLSWKKLNEQSGGSITYENISANWLSDVGVTMSGSGQLSIFQTNRNVSISPFSLFYNSTALMSWATNALTFNKPFTFSSTNDAATTRTNLGLERFMNDSALGWNSKNMADSFIASTVVGTSTVLGQYAETNISVTNPSGRGMPSYRLNIPANNPRTNAEAAVIRGSLNGSAPYIVGPIRSKLDWSEDKQIFFRVAAPSVGFGYFQLSLGHEPTPTFGTANNSLLPLPPETFIGVRLARSGTPGFWIPSIISRSNSTAGVLTNVGANMSTNIFANSLVTRFMLEYKAGTNSVISLYTLDSKNNRTLVVAQTNASVFSNATNNNNVNWMMGIVPVVLSDGTVATGAMQYDIEPPIITY